jgi:hypothetical protein
LSDLGGDQGLKAVTDAVAGILSAQLKRRIG